MSTNAPPAVVEAQNNTEDSNGPTETEGGAGDGVDVDGTEAGITEAAYDVCEARKKKGTINTNRKLMSFRLQLNLQHMPLHPPPPVQESQEYVDLVFAAMLKKIKMNLYDTEVMV